jgi:hypothetical protein
MHTCDFTFRKLKKVEKFETKNNFSFFKMNQLIFASTDVFDELALL